MPEDRVGKKIQIIRPAGEDRFSGVSHRFRAEAAPDGGGNRIDPENCQRKKRRQQEQIGGERNVSAHRQGLIPMSNQTSRNVNGGTAPGPCPIAWQLRSTPLSDPRRSECLPRLRKTG